MAKNKIEGSGGKYKIKGKDSIAGYNSEIELDIGSNDPNLYEVITKDIPEPTQHEGGTITWFNAYGIVVKATGKDATIRYTVTLNALPAGKTKLFALYDGAAHELPIQNAGNGKVKFTLSVGDPPVGAWP